MRRTWERKNERSYDPDYNFSAKGNAHPGMPDTNNEGNRDRYVRGEDYRPLRNPLHYADARILKEERDIDLKPYYGQSGQRG